MAVSKKKKKTRTTTILDLPKETIEVVFSYLDIITAGNFDSTCKRIRTIASTLWEKRLITEVSSSAGYYDQCLKSSIDFISIRQKCLFWGQFQHSGEYYEDLALLHHYNGPYYDHNEKMPSIGAAVQFEWETGAPWADGTPDSFLYCVRISRYIHSSDKKDEGRYNDVVPIVPSRFVKASCLNWEDWSFRLVGGSNGLQSSLQSLGCIKGKTISGVKEACNNLIITVTAVQPSSPGPPKLVCSMPLMMTDQQEQSAPDSYWALLEQEATMITENRRQQPALAAASSTTSNPRGRRRHQFISNPTPIDPNHPRESERSCSLQIETTIHINNNNEASQEAQEEHVVKVNLRSIGIMDNSCHAWDYGDDDDDYDYEGFAMATLISHERSVAKQNDKKYSKRGSWKPTTRRRRKSGRRKS